MTTLSLSRLSELAQAVETSKNQIANVWSRCFVEKCIISFTLKVKVVVVQ